MNQWLELTDKTGQRHMVTAIETRVPGLYRVVTPGDFEHHVYDYDTDTLYPGLGEWAKAVNQGVTA